MCIYLLNILNPASSAGSIPLTSVEGLQPLKINPSLTLSKTDTTSENDSLEENANFDLENNPKL